MTKEYKMKVQAYEYAVRIEELEGELVHIANAKGRIKKDVMITKSMIRTSLHRIHNLEMTIKEKENSSFNLEVRGRDTQFKIDRLKKKQAKAENTFLDLGAGI